MNEKATVIDTEQLIALVYKRPALWDNRLKGHLNRSVTASQWGEIGNIMKINERKLRKKWKYLRDQFAIESAKYKPLKRGEPASKSRLPKWAYFAPLLFLKDIVKPRPPNQNYYTTEVSSDSAIADDFQLEDPLALSETSHQEMSSKYETDENFQEIYEIDDLNTKDIKTIEEEDEATPTISSFHQQQSSPSHQCQQKAAPEQTNCLQCGVPNAEKYDSYLPENQDYDFAVAKVWATKLKLLTPEQKLYAEKAINDIFFEAQLKNVNRPFNA